MFGNVFDGMIGEISKWNARLEKREADVSRREADVSEREENVKGKEGKLGEWEGKLKQKSSELNGIIRAAELKQHAAEEVARISQEEFRKEEKVPKEISEYSLLRDKVIKEELIEIQETVKEIKTKIDTNGKSGFTDSEREVIENLKIMCKAKFFAIVAAYRDSLNDSEIGYFSIEGESPANFLCKLAQQISQDRENYWDGINGNWNTRELKLDEKLLNYIGSEYERIVNQKLGMKAERAYPGAAYTPFEGGFSPYDHRAVGPAVFKACMESKNRALKLYDSVANQPRSTINPEEKTEVEEMIGKIDIEELEL